MVRARPVLWHCFKSGLLLTENLRRRYTNTNRALTTRGLVYILVKAASKAPSGSHSKLERHDLVNYILLPDVRSLLSTRLAPDQGFAELVNQGHIMSWQGSRVCEEHAPPKVGLVVYGVVDFSGFDFSPWFLTSDVKSTDRFLIGANPSNCVMSGYRRQAANVDEAAARTSGNIGVLTTFSANLYLRLLYPQSYLLPRS